MVGGRASRRGSAAWRRSAGRSGDSLCNQGRVAIELRPAREAEAAGVRDVFRADAAGHEDSVSLTLSRRDAQSLPDRRWPCHAPFLNLRGAQN
jgi:hypothetical protein